MPPRFHRPIPQKKTGQKKAPQTADEFIEFGLELEESGDRWRSGDKAKAGRFYLKAISAYSSALELLSTSTDAAYNKARLQLTLTTNDGLLPPEINPRAMLHEALNTHLYCLGLPEGNSGHDIVFNTAQVYIALVEDYTSGNGAGDPQSMERAVEYLLKGVDLFDRALLLQEGQLESSPAQDIDMDDDEDGGITLQDQMESAESESTESTEQWALIKEPVTKSDVLDTIVAKLEALALLCGLAQYTYEFLQDPFQYARDAGVTLLNKLDSLLEGSPDGTTLELVLSRANFSVALSDLGFKTGTITVQEYTENIQHAFSASSLMGFTGPIVLVNKAEAYIQLAQALGDASNPLTASVRPIEILSHYTLAAKLLTEASGQDKTNARLHCLRGDVEMWRSRIVSGQEGGEKKMATVETLWGNAGVYYRGAKKVAEAYPNGQRDVYLEACVKELVSEVQKQLIRGGKGIEEVVGKVKRELEKYSGWDETVLECVRHGVLDERVLRELEG